MKRTFALLFVLLLVLSPQMVFASGEDTKVQLSSLSEEECRQFLLNQGVTIPKELENIKVKELFAQIEADPYKEILVNWSVIRNFHDAICAVVMEYYGLQTTSSGQLTTQTTRSFLRYNEVVDWDPETMDDYNCYGFAIGRISICNPGDFSNGTYVHTDSIENVARVVKNDLQGELGYSCVVQQVIRPESTTGWANVIALRKDTTMDFEYYGEPYNDFHFAKLTSNGWLHKPGLTAVLKFNTAPTNSDDWYAEGYNGTYILTNDTYDSNIIYFSYKRNHTITTRYAGEHYHSGASHWFLYEDVCTDCGCAISTDWIGQPCSGPPCSFGILRREMTEMVQS